MTLILFAYQAETFCAYELNKACRFKDRSKVPTLGPWASALGWIIEFTQRERTDIAKYDHNKQHDLWRGGGMTAAEIKEYQQMVGKKEKEYENN